MRILGIDPGIATIGFGVVDSDSRSHKLIKCGVITTPAHTSLSSRLEQIYDDMCGLLDMFKPDAVSIEELFFQHQYNDRHFSRARQGCHPAGMQKSRSQDI